MGVEVHGTRDMEMTVCTWEARGHYLADVGLACTGGLDGRGS